MTRGEDVLRAADPHLMTVDVVRLKLKESDPELGVRLFKARQNLFEAIKNNKKTEAANWMNTLKAISEAMLKSDRPLTVAVEALAKIVNDMPPKEAQRRV